MSEDRPEDTAAAGFRAGPSARRRPSISTPAKSPAKPRRGGPRAGTCAQPEPEPRARAANRTPAGGDFPLGHRAGLRRGRGGAGDRRRLDAGLAAGAIAPPRRRLPRQPRRARRACRGPRSEAGKLPPPRRSRGGRAARGAGKIAGLAARSVSARRARSRKSSPPIGQSGRDRPTAKRRARRISRRSTRGSIADRTHRRSARAPRSRRRIAQARPTTRRCAASWWHHCSISRCGRASRSRPR